MADHLPTRADILARYFLDHRGEWITRYRLGQLIGFGSVTQRMTEVRRMGFKVECRRQWIPKHRAVKTSYRYVPVARAKAA